MNNTLQIKPSLNSLINLVAADMKCVNNVIIHHMESHIQLIPQLASYIIASGGKRIRPMLTLAAARLCIYENGPHAINLAACIEFIHTATLLHDDVVDESKLRRGKISANTLFGNQTTVLVGDFLFARAFIIMVKTGSLKILDILSKASVKISEGEVLQLSTVNDLQTDENTYFQVIRSKTAALFGAACQVGAVISNCSLQDEYCLRMYGTYLGIIFQLVDDVLDYSAHQSKLGKKIGDDFESGKVTLPIIYAYKRSNHNEKQFWKRCIQKKNILNGDFDHAKQLIQKYNSLDLTIECAKKYKNMAINALSHFKKSEAKDALIETVEFCILRIS